MEITIACASDDGYAMPLAACLASALHYLEPSARMRVIVLDAGISPASRQKLAASLGGDRVSLELIDIQGEDIRKFPGRLHINWVSLSRLLLPRLLPGSVDKVIWLDCDLVVCADLTRLWTTETDGAALLAVAENQIGRVLSYAGELGIAPETPYFNAGVLVLDLAVLRRMDFTARALAFLEANVHRLVYQDQDVLNVVCAGRWRELDRRWNYRTSSQPASMEAIDRARDAPHPYIVHYASVPKPWHWGYGYDRPYSSYFFFALALTAWKGWQPPVRMRQVVRARFPQAYDSLKKLVRHVRAAQQRRT